MVAKEVTMVAKEVRKVAKVTKKVTIVAKEVGGSQRVPEGPRGTQRRN